MQLNIWEKKVIIAPLCWGLGHATRCIPIIDLLLAQNNTITIASDGEALTLLKKEYPQLQFHESPAYNIQYASDSMVRNMASMIPRFLSTLRKERKFATSLSESLGADVIISDNRFGFRARNTTNVYITHQVNIMHPQRLLSRVATLAHQKIINSFDECWIPDNQPPDHIAGDLSEGKLKIPKKYIGLLSRLNPQNLEKDIDILILLSGPEPKRTELENKISTMLKDANQKIVYLVRGTDKTSKTSYPEFTKTIDLAGGSAIETLLNRSKLVISRSGYSSIMDYIKLQQKAILIPTPGQTEQEYLAKRLSSNPLFFTTTQSTINKEFIFSVLEAGNNTKDYLSIIKK